MFFGLISKMREKEKRNKYWEHWIISFSLLLSVIIILPTSMRIRRERMNEADASQPAGVDKIRNHCVCKKLRNNIAISFRLVFT